MTYDDRYNRNDRHEDDYQYQEYQDHQYEDDYDYPADKRQWLLVRALRALSGTVAAGIVVLTLVIIGSAYLGGNRGFPGPGQRRSPRTLRPRWLLSPRRSGATAGGVSRRLPDRWSCSWWRGCCW